MKTTTKHAKFCFLLFTFTFLLFSLYANAQTCSPAPAGLVSWWTADGNTLDSRSRNNGTLQNSATFVSGKVGQAFSLDGVDDFIKVNASASLNVGTANGFTIEAWVNPQSNNGEPIIEFASPTTVGVHLWTSVGGANNLFAGLNSAIQSADNTVPLNQFSHVAVTYDKLTGLAQLFVNGVIVSSANVGIGVPATAFDMNIGGRTLFGLDKFHGNIDELSIYNRTLSLSEIQSIFNAGTAGKCKPTATVSPDGQVGWWPGDGNANDLAEANNGALQDNASFAPAKVGQAFSFDGTDDRIEIPNNATLSPSTISLEAWVKPASINIGSRVISKDISSVSCASPFVVYSLETRGEFGGRATFFYTTTDNVLHVLQGTTPIPLNVFSHISATYDGTTAKIYVNGILENSQAVSGTMRSSTTPVIIGNADAACRPLGGNTAGFNGVIDEPSIYNRAITQDEITSIFNAGIAGKLKQNATVNSSSLVSLWQGEGNANDTRGANNGTLTNGTTFASGKIGQVLSFDGVDDAVSTSANAFNSGVGTISIEAWVNPSTHGTDSSGIFGNTIISNTDVDGFALRLRNGVIQADLRLTSGNVLQTFGPALPLNQFSHVAITYDGTNVRAFLNGVQTGSIIPATGTIRNTANSGICLMIGNDPGFPCVTTNDGFDFHGLIDEAAIYDRALSPTEVRANYEAGNALSTVAGDARVTFPTVSTAGITQQIPLDLSTLPSLPLGSTTTDLTYDIATTATFTGSPQVCFILPSITNPTAFGNLRILHLESNAWTNRTDLASINFAAKTVCTSGLTSLSPFAVVNGFAPSAANASIGGRVLTANGSGIRNVIIQLTSGTGETKYARSNSFGYYRFTDLPVGQTYILSVSAKKYTFADPTRVISLTEDLTDEDFVAEDTK